MSFSHDSEKTAKETLVCLLSLSYKKVDDGQVGRARDSPTSAAIHILLKTLAVDVLRFVCGERQTFGIFHDKVQKHSCTDTQIVFQAMKERQKNADVSRQQLIQNSSTVFVITILSRTNFKWKVKIVKCLLTFSNVDIILFY